MKLIVDPAALRPRQAATFAAGLWYLAKVDGAAEAELAVIREFLEATGQDLAGDTMEVTAFDPAAAAAVLDTPELRRSFLQAAVALLRADGDISDAEFEALRAVAVAFDEKPALLTLLARSG